jgi:hypothetical protein
MVELQDWQKRVVQELNELSAKVAALESFLAGPVDKVQPLERGLLWQQYSYMTGYQATLQARIGSWS